jgi:hypothetical protein
VSAAASGIGLGKQSPHAAWRWSLRAIAAAAVLLVAALAAGPAAADDTAIAPPLSAGSAAPPDDGQATATAPQSNSTTSTQTATATGGAGGTATGGSAGPSQGAGGTSQGGNAYANGGQAGSHNSVENKQSNQNSSGSGGGTRYGSGDGDTFVVETPKKQGSDRAAARKSHARSSKRLGPATAGRTAPLDAKTRSGHESGKASQSDGALPGHGRQLPGQNPFFNLLSGSGGAGTGLVLLLLAVLGMSIALPRRHFKAFRTPAVPWRPLAYVPPIELPG